MKKMWIGLIVALLLISLGAWWYIRHQQTAAVRFQNVVSEYGSRPEFPQVETTLKLNFEILEKNPQDAQALMAIGTSFYVLDAYSEAITYYQQLEQLQPDNFLAYYNAGKAYQNLQQYATAEEQYYAALRRNPNDLVVMQALDELYRYHLSEKADAMRKLYNDAIAENPERPEFKQALDAFNAFMVNKK